MSTTSDHDLIERTQQGDVEAFEALFERYAEALRRYMLAILCDEAAAQDLVQEVFLRVWTHASQWSGQGPPKAWLYRIATNQAFNYLRSRRRRPEQSLENTQDADSSENEAFFPQWMVDTASLGPDLIVEQEERRQRLQGLIMALPDEKRQVFHLVLQMELSIHDAADELGIPEGTAKSRLHYAKSWLHQEWNRQESQ